MRYLIQANTQQAIFKIDRIESPVHCKRLKCPSQNIKNERQEISVADNAIIMIVPIHCSAIITTQVLTQESFGQRELPNAYIELPNKAIRINAVIILPEYSE